MKKIVLFSFAVFLFNCSSIFSQGFDTASSKKVKHFSRWSLQFEVGYSFDVNSYQNLIFSTKYAFTPVTAIRFGAGVAVNKNNKELEENEKTYPYKDEYYDIKLITDFLFYPNPKALIKFYFGIGPQAYYLRDVTENLDISYEKVVKDEEGWGGGISVILGGEWFALSRLSFFAEYRTAAVLQKNTTLTYRVTQENITWNKIKNKSDSFIIRPEDAMLGISLYF